MVKKQKIYDIKNNNSRLPTPILQSATITADKMKNNNNTNNDNIKHTKDNNTLSNQF